MAEFPWFDIILVFTLLTFNSGLAIYQSRDDIESMAFAAVSFLDVLLLFAWRLACYKRRLDGCSPGIGRRLVDHALKAAVWCLTVLLTLALANKLARIIALSTSSLLLMAVAAGATAFGCCCSFCLHRDGWFDQPRHEATLPLVQQLTSQTNTAS